MKNKNQKTGTEYWALLDSLHVAVLLFDQNLHLQYINSACETMLDISARQIKNQHVDELAPIITSRIIDTINRATYKNQLITDREIAIPRPNERIITVDCTVTPHLETQIHHDCTLVELQAIDRHIRISDKEKNLEQQQVSQDLIRGLAHEIKNPLGGLRGAAQLLEAELADQELVEYTQIIIKEADRLRTLINRLLGPNKQSTMCSLSIYPVLQRVRQLILAEANNHLQITLDYDPSLPNISGDHDRLIQAFLNIVSNAAEAMHFSGSIIFRTRVHRQFTIGQQQHRLVASIEVIDNGPGIPKEMQHKIFFPLVTGRPEGTGLGLSIAQQIINEHKGLITCSSQPGMTTFTVYLPLEGGS